MRRIGMSLVTAICALWVFGFFAASGPAQNKTTTQPGTVKGNFQGSIQQTPWFSTPEIRQQFKFNDDQFNRLNKAYQESWTRYNTGVSGLDKTLSAEQRDARMRELEQGFYKDFSGVTGNIITDPAQQQRYNQLYLQYRGYGAFQDPMVTEKLKLTPEQRMKLGTFGQEWSKQMSDLAPMYQKDREGATSRFTKMQSEYNERINSVLTPEQRQTWQQMRGDAYTFPPSAYFPSSTGTTPNPNPNK